MSNKSEISLRNVWWFVFLSIVCSVIAWHMMQSANKRLEATHSIIIRHQQKSMESIDSLLVMHRNLIKDSTIRTDRNIINQLNQQLLNVAQYSADNDNNQRIVNLLESELSKIQNEYEVLNLWCALLTVVFLIFSFFSIFKANEMANQSEAALKDMRIIERDVQSKSDSIDTKVKEANSKIDVIDQSISTLQLQHDNLVTMTKTIKETEIEGLNTQIKDLKSSMKRLFDSVSTEKEDFNRFCETKKSDFVVLLDSELGVAKQSVEDLATSSYKEQNESFLKRMDKIENSLDKLLKDFQELTTGDIDQEAIAEEEEEERNINDDDEDEIKSDDGEK